MKAARDVGRGHVPHEGLILPDRVGAERLAHVAVEVDAHYGHRLRVTRS